MGLFDRIKQAFTGQSQETKEAEETKVEEKEVEEVKELEQAPEIQPVEEEKTEKVVEEEPQEEPIEQDATTEKYEKGLAKTRKTFSGRMNELFANFRTVDEEFFEELEEVLIESDVGFEVTMELTETLRQEVKLKNAKNQKEVQQVILEKMVDIYEQTETEDRSIALNKDGLTIILFVGVNGVGKTTSIAKLAHQYIGEGKKVVMAAGDTFRAGAIEQLQVWGERVGATVIAGKAGGDPASVVFDAVKFAKAEQADVLFVDTAGRLQNKVNLMKELEKMKRVITKEVPDGPHEVLLVLDATTGQNALIQARQFKETTEVTGIVLTKLDGTAKGGIVLAIRKELGIPVKFVGLGESMNDLEEFDTNDFVYGLFSELIKETL